MYVSIYVRRYIFASEEEVLFIWERKKEKIEEGKREREETAHGALPSFLFLPAANDTALRLRAAFIYVGSILSWAGMRLGRARLAAPGIEVRRGWRKTGINIVINIKERLRGK